MTPRAAMPAKKKAPPDDLLATAADVRAGGGSWEAVAAAVGRAADTVRRWPALYPKPWARLTRLAERRLLSEATAESVHTLRRQLRSDDEKGCRDAAQKLIQFRVALTKKQAKPRADTALVPARESDAMRIAAYLETLSDAQLDDLLADLLSDPALDHLRRPPSAGGGRPGPP